MYKSGIGYTTISVNPLIYLPWLKSQLESRNVQFIRKKVRSIEEAADVAGPDGIIVNATSLGARFILSITWPESNFVVGSRSLIGVHDVKMYPIRGQTVLVHAPDVHDFLGDTEGVFRS